jgi:hypothetical protein
MHPDGTQLHTVVKKLFSEAFFAVILLLILLTIKFYEKRRDSFE